MDENGQANLLFLCCFWLKGINNHQGKSEDSSQYDSMIDAWGRSLIRITCVGVPFWSLRSRGNWVQIHVLCHCKHLRSWSLISTQLLASAYVGVRKKQPMAAFGWRLPSSFSVPGNFKVLLGCSLPRWGGHHPPGGTTQRRATFNDGTTGCGTGKGLDDKVGCWKSCLGWGGCSGWGLFGLWIHDFQMHFKDIVGHIPPVMSLFFMPKKKNGSSDFTLPEKKNLMAQVPCTRSKLQALEEGGENAAEKRDASLWLPRWGFDTPVFFWVVWRSPKILGSEGGTFVGWKQKLKERSLPNDVWRTSEKSDFLHTCEPSWVFHSFSKNYPLTSDNFKIFWLLVTIKKGHRWCRSGFMCWSPILRLGGDEGKKRRLLAAGPAFNVAVICKNREGRMRFFVCFFGSKEVNFFKLFSGASRVLLFYFVFSFFLFGQFALLQKWNRFVEESKFRQLTKDELWKVGSKGKILPQVPQEQTKSGKKNSPFVNL